MVYLDKGVYSLLEESENHIFLNSSVSGPNATYDILATYVRRCGIFRHTTETQGNGKDDVQFTLNPRKSPDLADGIANRFVPI